MLISGGALQHTYIHKHFTRVVYVTHIAHILINNTSTTNTLTKIQIMANINLLHISELGCHPQGVLKIQAIQDQHAIIGTETPHWDD